jgi:FAD/FMN-containing dehydrogenase
VVTTTPTSRGRGVRGERLPPWSCGGRYVNHLAADEGRDRVRDAYGAATWDRLVSVKRRHDPTNVFHLNQNIDVS